MLLSAKICITYKHKIIKKKKYGIGTTFSMGQSSTIYAIDSFNDTHNYYKCIVQSETTKNDDNKIENEIYLNCNQLNFVKIITNNKLKKEEELKTDIKSDKKRAGIYSLTMNEDEDYETVSKHLPYFTDFMLRQEKSVLNQNDFKHDPSGYLKAIRNKYNIRHPRQFDMNSDQQYDGNSTSKISVKSTSPTAAEEDLHLRPWIEGKMEKLMAETGYFGTEKWKTRLFRLFDEALVWFDDEPSFFKKLFNRRSSNKNKRIGVKANNSNNNNNNDAQSDNEEDINNLEDDNDWMSPFGVLPLAMITGLKTCDVDKMDGNVSEDELLRLELEIGDEGVIILKCSDFNQRIKWYECLHTAIFTVKRPLFTKDKDLWRIAEPKVSQDKTGTFGKNTTTSLKRQITKEDIVKNDEKRRKPMHVRMGQSLAFKLSDIKAGWATNNSFDDDDGKHSPVSLSNNDQEIELPDFNGNLANGGSSSNKSGSGHDRVPSLSNRVSANYSNSVKVL